MTSVRVVTFTADNPEALPASQRHLGLLFDGKVLMPIRINAPSQEEAQTKATSWWKNELEKIRRWPERARAKAKAQAQAEFVEPSETPDSDDISAEEPASALTEMDTNQEQVIPAAPNGGIVVSTPEPKAKRQIADDDIL